MFCETLVVCCDVRTAFVPIVETSVTEIEAATPSSFGRESADYLIGMGAIMTAMSLLVMIHELIHCTEDAIVAYLLGSSNCKRDFSFTYHTSRYIAPCTL